MGQRQQADRLTDGHNRGPLTRADVISALRLRRHVRGDDLTLLCERTGANAYRDVLEAVLVWSGVRRWTWQDGRGARVRRQTVGRIAWNLGRDLMAWLPLYLYMSWIVYTLSRRTRVRCDASFRKRFLHLRVDHWFDVVSGGSVGHLSGVIHGLRRSGYPTLVISTDRLVGVEADASFQECVPEYRVGRNIPTLPLLLYNRQLMDHMERYNAVDASTCVYQRYSAGNFAGVLIKARHGVPYVCEYNGSEVWIAKNWGRRLMHERLFGRVEMLNLTAADLVVVVSDALKQELTARGVEPRKILVNPNGVDPMIYSPEISDVDVRRRYALDGKTVIGFIGTMSQWHGVEVLVAAFNHLVARTPAYRETVRLLLVGDGPRMDAIRSTIHQLDLDDCVVMTGLVPQYDGPSHLAACDILASPHVGNPDGTPFFGSPTKLFEYMAMGRAIVASALDQIEEVLHHDKTAYLVAPGDVDALADGLDVLINNRDLRGRLGEAARKDVLSKYTWAHHTRRILAALHLPVLA